MNIRQVVGHSAVSGTVAAVAFLAVSGLVKAFTAGAKASRARVIERDGQYLVAVRGSGQYFDIRDFIQPFNPGVVAIAQEIGPDVNEQLDWVCRNIEYLGEAMEYWRFPAETLAGQGDCEDTAILLTSMLRNFYPADIVSCVIGEYSGYGHAWCQFDHYVLETTLSRAGSVNKQDYIPHAAFNDLVAIELWPGALQEVFSLKKNQDLTIF